MREWQWYTIIRQGGFAITRKVAFWGQMDLAEDDEAGTQLCWKWCVTGYGRDNLPVARFDICMN